MAKARTSSARCLIIAGPNGAEKTTFAREFLDNEAGIVHFVNPDLIASGLSPLRPELAALAAGRLFLRELNRLAPSKEDFAFESTLSGLTYIGMLKRRKATGYRNLSARFVATYRASTNRRACQTRRPPCAARRCSASVHSELEQLRKPLQTFSGCLERA